MQSSVRQASCIWLAFNVAVASAAGCTGKLATGDSSDGHRTSARSADVAGYAPGDEGLYDKPAPSTRYGRLTHTQWANSVRDLFYLDDASSFAAEFRTDPHEQGFLFNTYAGRLSVDDTLWASYQSAASEVAEYVTEDATRLAKILPAATEESEARAKAFIEQFGARAYRRPLETTEVDEYLTLYRSAGPLYSGVSAFNAGIRLLIEALLQSPHFLYRVELSADAIEDVIPLSSYEVAARLSYLVWNSMPDDALFAAAASGDLSRASVVAEHAQRMLDDPRAEATIADFHSQLFDHERYSTIAPSPVFYPDTTETLAASAARENELFVRDMLFRRSGSYRDLLTSNDTFVNADLARIYGLPGTFGASFAPATLDSAQRRGFLTQVGFLASHATSVLPDPIHRGVFLAKRIACIGIAAPPDDIPPLPAPDGRTNRETIEQHTQQEGTICATCHEKIINPFGFPFESYDAIGQWRTEDSGYPVNTASDPMLGAEPVHVTDALDLVEKLAESQRVHECYAKHWLEYAYGRPKAAPDATLVERLGVDSVQDNLSVKQLILGLVKTEAFLTRSTQELP